ncbi:YdcF family protein [Kitasatospora sp. NPDC049258]|uniref:YdcF family protein n=1 Tax=Kitasatospora sp. NPDC049258 TaxID=3155394 RepID=UPI00341265B4
MVAYVLAAVFLVLLALGVRRDVRRFSNAVLLGLAVTFTVAGLLGELARLPDGVLRAAVDVLPAAAALGVAVVAVLLVGNGVVMVRQEGGRPANLLSLATGIGGFGLIALLWAAAHVDSGALHAVATAALLVAGYLSFLLLCFVGYAALYGRLPPRDDVDFVVVLGAGLVNGDQVPPLLAGRLDLGIALAGARTVDGRSPVLVVSGGKGSDEQVPEATAMAGYAVDHGVPAARVRCEDRSRSTAENLLFSAELMQAERPGYRCTVVTSSFHVLRAALATRRAGVRGQVVGARTAGYYWPSAMLREFAAVLLSYPRVNAGAVLLLVVVGAAAGWRS